MVEDGDVVKIDYIGRIQNTGEIFDLTSEEAAEEEGYDTEGMELGPVEALIGADHLISGLENAVREMEEGESMEVSVAAADAFGDRDSDQVRTIPEREFEEYDVRPRRGMVVEVDGQRGKIISKTSGRVKVDFNHPLAGKDLAYEIDLLEVLDNAEDRVDAVLAFYGLDEAGAEASVEDETVTVELPDDAADNDDLREQLEHDLELVKGVDAVEITA